MSAQKEDLSKFRKEIDQIDDQIIDLLKERIQIVQKVGKYKSQTSSTHSFIRAGREAAMLRNLTQKIDGKFPPAAIATIWRMIISTSLCLEQGLSISAYTKPGNETCYWHAREYYGSFVKTTKEDNSDKVINNVVNKITSIGLLPLFDDSNNPWWSRPESEKNDVYIFARIPFVQTADDVLSPTLAIAHVMPEATDDDVSIVVVKCDDSTDKIKSAFALSGLSINIIASNHNRHLVEIDTFLSIGDISIKKVTDKLSNGSIRLMGAYATPMKI